MDIELIKSHIDDVLPGTDFTVLGPKKVGKVRDVYDHGGKLMLIATDRYSAFDRNLALIPFKGEVLTGITKFWFDKTKDIVRNHFLEMPDPNVIVAKRCIVLPVEVTPVIYPRTTISTGITMHLFATITFGSGISRK